MLGRSVLAASLDARHELDLMPAGSTERLLPPLLVLLADSSRRNHFYGKLEHELIELSSQPKFFGVWHRLGQSPFKCFLSFANCVRDGWSEIKETSQLLRLASCRNP